jgi:glycerol uptake facilitator-like aquaporin
MITRQRVAVLVAEFLGTMLLALTVLVVASSQLGLSYFVAFAAGLALIFLVFAVGGISGALFNPAITIGLWTIRKITTKRALAYIVVQLLGGFAAFMLYGYLHENTVWANRAVGYDSQVLVAEVIGTAVLAFGIATAIYRGLDGGAKAFTIGGGLILGVILASTASAGFLNPAVAISLQYWDPSTYVLGPVLGAIIGFNLYNLLYSAAMAPGVSRVKPAKAGKPKSFLKRSK